MRNLTLALVAITFLAGCYTLGEDPATGDGGSNQPWPSGQGYNSPSDDDDATGNTPATDDDDTTAADDDDSTAADDDDTPAPTTPCVNQGGFTDLEGEEYVACSYPVIESLTGANQVGGSVDTISMVPTFGAEGPALRIEAFEVRVWREAGSQTWFADNIEGLATNLGGDAAWNDAGCVGNTCTWVFISQALVDYLTSLYGGDVNEEEAEAYEAFMEAFVESFVGVYNAPVVIYDGEFESIQMLLHLAGGIPGDAALTWKVGGMIINDGSLFDPVHLYQVDEDDEMVGNDQTKTVTFTGSVPPPPIPEVTSCDLSIVYTTPGSQTYDRLSLQVGSWDFTDVNGQPLNVYATPSVRIVTNASTLAVTPGYHWVLQDIPAGAIVGLDVTLTEGGIETWSCMGNSPNGSFSAVCNDGTAEEVNVTSYISTYSWGGGCSRQLTLPANL